MINVRSNRNTNQDSDSPQVHERYFSKDGRVLPEHYSFIYDKSTEVAKHYSKDLSWVRPGDSLDQRRAAAKANGWGVGGGYCRCNTKMQDSYEGQMAACINKAIVHDVIIFPELMAGDKAVRKGMNRLCK